jgi:hypothetical protein
MKIEQFLKRDYWLALAPSLHIDDQSLFEKVTYLELNPQVAAQFRDEGYLQGSADWGLDVKLMAETIRLLSASELSPLFGYLYDEFWLPFYKMRPLYGALLGGKYFLLPDFWIWNVDPKKGEAGWKPHRDKGKKSLLEDGSPKSLTTWIPLSAATPLNGCMYIVPAQYDPTYGTADETKMKFDHQSIRALPGGPGDFFIWNQAIFHWGSRSSPRAAESRVSMAFELQRADVPPFNTPLIDPLVVPPFERRLELVAKQIQRYRHMYEVDPKVAAMAAELLAVVAPALPAPAPSAAPTLAVASAGVAPAVAAPMATRPAITSDPATWGSLGRNDVCPCGSGKKYKHCHGRVA